MCCFKVKSDSLRAVSCRRYDFFYVVFMFSCVDIVEEYNGPYHFYSNMSTTQMTDACCIDLWSVAKWLWVCRRREEED